MRFARVLRQDIRYQIKYGFYFLYAFMSALYIGILLLLPMKARLVGAVLVILTDPAMLGFFFIGGIWLLEKGEGLHSYWSVLPAKPVEYILSKVISLALVSTLSGVLIISLSGAGTPNYWRLCVAIILGAGIFTLAGLTFATWARSVNHYLIITVPVELALLIPPTLMIFGIRHPLLAFFPGVQLYQALRFSIGLATEMDDIWIFGGLLFWLVIALRFALFRVPAALRQGGTGGWE